MKKLLCLGRHGTETDSCCSGVGVSVGSEAFFERRRKHFIYSFSVGKLGEGRKKEKPGKPIIARRKIGKPSNVFQGDNCLKPAKV